MRGSPGAIILIGVGAVFLALGWSGTWQRVWDAISGGVTPVTPGDPKDQPTPTETPGKGPTEQQPGCPRPKEEPYNVVGKPENCCTDTYPMFNSGKQLSGRAWVCVNRLHPDYAKNIKQLHDEGYLIKNDVDAGTRPPTTGPQGGFADHAFPEGMYNITQLVTGAKAARYAPNVMEDWFM